MDTDIWVGIINNDKLYIKFDYDKEKVRKIKTINGRQWEPDEKYWTVPYTEESIDKITEVFSSNTIKFHNSITFLI